MDILTLIQKFLISIAVCGIFYLGGYNVGLKEPQPDTLFGQEVVSLILDRDELKSVISSLADHPMAIDIIRCESGFRAKAFNLKTRDIGYFQINDYWHREKSLIKGFDVYKPLDNLKYGLELLSEPDGLKYWKASRHCWKG